MQDLESTKQTIDLQQIQIIKQEPIDSSSINSPPAVNKSAKNSIKKIDNRFQASLERQRILWNMQQEIALLPSHQTIASSSLNESDNDDKLMNIQVDSNNNTMPILLLNRQSSANLGILPSINELRNPRTLNNFSTDNLLVNTSDKRLISRSNSMLLNAFNQNNQFNNGQIGDENEFESHFEEDDYSRLSHTNTMYDNYELNQSIKMEDAFQDDKLDFKAVPTLSELNLNDDDMMDNLPTVNPNSVLCPSYMPLQAKNGFLMGINYTAAGLSASTSDSSTTNPSIQAKDSNQSDLVSSYSHSLNNNHLNTSTNNGSKNNGFNRSTNDQQSSTSKQSYNTRKRGRNKSDGDKPNQRRMATSSQQRQPNNLSQSNQVLCKLLNEKNENNSLNNLNSIYLINATESQLIHNAIASEQSIASTSTNSHFQTICVSPLSSASSSTTQISPQLSSKSISPNQLSPLQNDLLFNQLQATLNQTKCGLQVNNLRLNNHHNSAARNRNSSISTEHSFSSSHDEGFISQAEEDSDELLDDSQMVCDPKSLTGNNKQPGKVKRKRARKDMDKESNLISSEQEPIISRNMKKIKLEDNQLKPSTSSGFTSTLSTVKEERVTATFSTTSNKNREEKFGTKGRVNYKITKDKQIPSDIQQTPPPQQMSPPFNDKQMTVEEKIEDEESSDDEDDDSFYGDYDANDLIGATTSDDQLNKWSLNMGRSRKNSAQRYFWQYNVQSKGPKGTKLTTSISDHALDGDIPTSSNSVGSDLEPLDPVFSPNCQIEGVKHAGKARRGDGNDLTANPKKLLLIGLELKKLSKIINDLTPVSDVPQNSKSNSRKEKNKLASRACRLKKKAQHEANKIKLHGLSVEYKKLLTVNSEFKRIQERTFEQGTNLTSRKLIDQLNVLLKEKGPIINIAGKSTEFVNSVLDSVSSGNCNGGLEKL